MIWKKLRKLFEKTCGTKNARWNFAHLQILYSKNSAIQRLFDICNRKKAKLFYIRWPYQNLKLSLLECILLDACVCVCKRKTASFQLTSVSKNTIEQATASDPSGLNFFLLFHTCRRSFILHFSSQDIFTSWIKN